MSYIQLYQAATASLSVNIANDDGTPFNASGYALWFTAKQNYSDPNYLINVGVTGEGINLPNALTGLFTINLTTGDTNICPGVYSCAGFTLTGGNPLTVSPIPQDGLEVLPSYFNP